MSALDKFRFALIYSFLDLDAISRWFLARLPRSELASPVHTICVIPLIRFDFSHDFNHSIITRFRHRHPHPMEFRSFHVHIDINGNHNNTNRLQTLIKCILIKYLFNRTLHFVPVFFVSAQKQISFDTYIGWTVASIHRRLVFSLHFVALCTWKQRRAN